MKEKLSKIRYALTQYIGVVYSVNDRNDFSPQMGDGGIHAREAITILDSILAELESAELMSAVVTAIANTALNYSKKNDGKCLSTTDFSWAMAQAAIDTIKGE